MGKGLQHQDSSITLEGNPPGCMRGILNHFNHHRWHQVRKRLPHKRQGSGKQAFGNNAIATDSGNIQERLEGKADNSPIVAKSTEPGQVSKWSMKSRIKALITDEVSKRRGKHRRSSSCPTRMPLERATSIQHLDPADLQSSLVVPLNYETSEDSYKGNSYVDSLLDPLLPTICVDAVNTTNTCELCAAMLGMKHLNQCDVKSHGKKPCIDHIIFQHQSAYSRERTRNASIQESKLFLDALDLLNMRKEVFTKIVQDPNSSLANQLHTTRESKLRSGFVKSVSFPPRGSLGRRAVRERNPKHTHGCGCYAKGEDKSQISSEVSGSAGFDSAEQLNSHSVTSTDLSSEDDVGKHVLMRRESFDNYPQSSPSTEKKRSDSKLVLKRFRNLREKIRHALKESRKEKRRIIMDAVLHKVPYGRRSSKSIKKGANIVEEPPTADGHVTYCQKRTCSHYNSPYSKSEMQFFSRTSSFNESLDRYNRLYECCFSREDKQHIADRSSIGVSGSASPARNSNISLARILSLPDLRYYPSFKFEDTPEASTSGTLSRVASSNNFNVGVTRFNEQKSLDVHLGSENQTRPDYNSDSKSTENFLDVRETFDDFGGLTTEENSSSVEDNTEATSSPDSKLEESIPTPPPDLIFQDATDGASSLSEAKGADADAEDDVVNIVEKGLSADELNRILTKILVDDKNKAEFNYVKDVLELSGFSGNEILGKWHSAEQPMNPLVFDEVEGCLLVRPDSLADEEGGSCNQLLLFDLINEVLLQIYDRSFSYWPKSLTYRSHIHPMPAGYHVIGEVWADISWCLNSKLEVDQPIDDAVSRDLAKGDNWMNHQFDAECVALELEDLIFDELLDELIYE